MERPRFRLRLNCIDFYQATPSGFDPPLFGRHGSTQQKDAPSLPVVRVFGATETGQKVCAHIHGALPYLFIGYDGSLEKADVDAFIHQLRVSIDHALAVSYRRNIYDSKARFVGHITLVKGVPFFGYHVGYRYFLKIYMLNPINMTRFSDLLIQGAIMKQVFQPFEGHLQYLAQWMCDFNLYGCSYIDCDKYMFREPLPGATDLSAKHKWHDQSIQADWVSPPEQFPRLSHCSLELDLRVEDIVNRAEVEPRDLHASFAEHFRPGNLEEKLVRSLAGLWKDESKRRKRRLGITDNSSSPFPPEVLVSMSADSRNADKGGWIQEEEYREKVEDLVHDEAIKLDRPQPRFDDFVQGRSDDQGVKSALESVEDLFSNNLRAVYEQDEQDQLDDSHNNLAQTQAIVDEASIPNIGNDDFPYEWDENDVFQPGAGDAAAAKISRSRHTLNDMSESDHPPTVNGSAIEPHPASEVAEATTAHKYQKASGDTNYDSERVQPTSNEAISDPRAEFPDDRPAKRRKLDDFQVTPEMAEELSDEFLESQDNAKVAQAETPSSSQQLSQSRIKAVDGGKGAIPGFRVSKSSPVSNRQKQAETPVTPAPRYRSSAVPPSLLNTVTPCTRDKRPSLVSSPIKLEKPLPSFLTKTASQCSSSLSESKELMVYEHPPPGCKAVSESLTETGIATVVYQDAYYSDDWDVPERARDYAGREFKLMGSTVPYLQAFDPSGMSPAIQGDQTAFLLDNSSREAMFDRSRQRCRMRNWEYKPAPPTWHSVQHWLRGRDSSTRDAKRGQPRTRSQPKLKKTPIKGKKSAASQIEGPTQKDAHGFEYSQKRKSTSVQHETQYMSTMSLEVHVNTRQHFVPNPEEDEVACIFWCIKRDDEQIHEEADDDLVFGILLLANDQATAGRVSQETSVEVEWWPNELDLMNRMVDIVREYDPDILTGYEIHNGSWGYLIERARIKYEFDLCDEFSRMVSQSHGRFGKDADRWGYNTTSTLKVTGRHVINVWRAMRSELNLLQYTMENVVFHLLHKRIPHYTFSDLTAFFTSQKTRDISKCLQYFLSRTRLNLDILDANELVPRTSEQARLIGVDFFSVFSRGSQFKVESFMFRIAKPENFLLVSPSRKQVGQQNALECLPLVMEPQSAFYPSPLLVLDFQSLYPSIMIAYNYCYSTCLGRVVNWRGQNKMGFADFKREPGLLQLVKDSINIAPNGMMYVKQDMRKSLLAKMLGEILETRLMVKSGMKADKDDKTLQQLLNNRQLALKLLANVTYGYTSASFSGRMPCSEIADSIVQTGRETLEKAIALIHSVERWGAEVVYGDTDSLFVYLKRRTRDQAFDIGNEIAEAVTKVNPRPIKLKFEKVYHPCVLLAKKRYVGFKYESKDQTEPEFDAKGIETVRRDGTPAEQKIEEKALKILFRTADLSQVKSYFLRQCAKIMTGKVSIQDFCFAREVKLGTYADKGPPPPGALISTKRMLEDARTEPQYGERVPYVVVTGAPSARLIDRCVAPETLLKDDGADLDAEYYISKNLIPPLERIFNLVGANVRQWYDEMPKVHRIRDVRAPQQPGPAYAPNGAPLQPVKTLEGYLHTSHCVVCRSKLPQRKLGQKAVMPVCASCLGEPASSLYTMQMRAHEARTTQSAVHAVCRSCSGLAWAEEVRCDSKDCPVFYSRVRADRRRERADAAAETAVGALKDDALGRREGWDEW